MRGRYPYYLTYETSIATILRTGGNAPPVADATLTPQRRPRAPGGRRSTAVPRRTRTARSSTTAGTSATARRRPARPGDARLRPARAATSPRSRSPTTQGAAPRHVTEVVVRRRGRHRTRPRRRRRHARRCTGPSCRASEADDVPLRVRAPTSSTRATPDRALAAGGERRGRRAGRGERAHRRARRTATGWWRRSRPGRPSGPERTFTAGEPSGARRLPRRRARDARAARATGGWARRAAGRPSTSSAARPGGYTGDRRPLGQPGALRGDPDTAAAFDGTTGEMTAGHAAAHHGGDARGLVPLAGRRRRDARQHRDVGHGLDPRLRQRRHDRLPRGRDSPRVVDPGGVRPRRLAPPRADARPRRRAALPRRPAPRAPGHRRRGRPPPRRRGT